MNASEILIETIHEWGVDVVFGLPGDGINGIVEALRKKADKVRFIHVRHEEAAAFMACAYAKFTGKLGCCLATSGPGAIHLLNGLYDAKLDGAPVLAITGMQFHDLLHTHTQQDVELDKLFMDVCVYDCRVMGPNHMENVAELACRTALSYRGVSHITIPVDFQELEVGEKNRSKRNVAGHVSETEGRGARLPSEADLKKAAATLNAGRKVAILVGQGALGAAAEIEQTAEKLGAPVIKALLGKGVLPDHSAYTTGGIGLLGTKPSDSAMQDCDTLLIVGSSFPYIEFYPKPGQAKAVQIELDPAKVGLRYPIDTALVGDSRRTLQALLPHLKRNADRSFLEEAQAGMRDWWALMEKRGTNTATPMKPQVVAWELGKRLNEDAIVSCDSGTITTWFARQIPAKHGQLFSLSGNLATMANGLPYAIAAQVAYPERTCVAFVGDGGFTMLMGELATAVKYKLPIKVVVIKNNELGQIKWEQMVFLGNPEFGTDLDPNIDFAMFARACGATGLTITDPQKCGEILDQALATPGPVVIEAVVDKNEAPMPASTTVEQAAMFARSVAKGTTDAGKIVRNVIAGKIRELV